ncbi:hypothetical protein [Streptomyces sp. NPDC091027]|uniref:hypothetical protein n=1 Tax=Streptomyces sp. NPDC091027 TaxID=3365971 RepID=UPI0037FB5FEF
MSHLDEEWIWDDVKISADSVVFRRVLGRPDFLVPDLEGGPGKPGIPALKWDSDGISTYRQELLEELNLSPRVLKTSPTDLVFAFRVGDIRSADAGVVDTPDEEDELKGQAHTSIRCSEENPKKERRNSIRLHLIDSCWHIQC